MKIAPPKWHKGATRALKLLSVSASAAVIATAAKADSLFAESFESYASGTNLIGQGGWVSNFSGSTVPINSGNYLPSKVLDGRNAAASQQSVFGHAVPALDASLITVLTYDAFATGDSPQSHNDVVYLSDSPLAQITVATGWTPKSFQGPLRWNFTVGANSIDIAGGYNAPVHMSIVVNGVTNEVYGIYDFGSGPLQTPHYSVDDAFISSLDSIYIGIDRRGTGGVEIDNVVLATVPEPPIFVALSLGLIALSLAKRHSARQLEQRRRPPRHRDA